MTDARRLGPIALCTLIARDGKVVADAYCRWLHQQLVSAGEIDRETAAAVGYPELCGNRNWLLANERGKQWLHILEAREAVEHDSLKTLGWMAMEVLVEDVDRLADSLLPSPFELLRPPANLDVSDQIRACQALGPAGEVLYLTQINGPVPPFELPSCEAPVDHLFIPVLSTPSRNDSLDEYSYLSGNKGLSFDTRITVINQARNFDLDRRHPVATLQLAGNALIEMDQIAESKPRPAGVCTGMASVAFHYSGDPIRDLTPCNTGPFTGYRTASLIGHAGERYTLICN